MKKVTFALVAALAVLVFTGSAFAVSSLTIDGKATLSNSKTSVTATGTIVCPVGALATVTVSIVQTSGQTDTHGFASDDFTCSGQVQTWAVVVNVFIGEGYKNGPATAVFSASSCTTVEDEDGGETVFCSFMPASVEGIKIQK